MNQLFLGIIILLMIPLFSIYGQSDIDTDFSLYKGNQYLKLGEYEQAIFNFDNVLEEDPHNIEALINKGNALFTLLKYDEAIPYFEQAILLEPENQIALIKLHDSLLKIADYRYGFLDGFLEIKVHDSSGGLIAYQKVTNIFALEHELTKNLVKKWPVIQVISKDSKNFAIHQNEFIEVLAHDTILGFHQIPYSEKINLPLSSTWYYQIPVEKGDVVNYLYSIYLPVS